MFSRVACFLSKDHQLCIYDQLSFFAFSHSLFSLSDAIRTIFFERFLSDSTHQIIQVRVQIEGLHCINRCTQRVHQNVVCVVVSFFVWLASCHLLLSREMYVHDRYIPPDHNYAWDSFNCLKCFFTVTSCILFFSSCNLMKGDETGLIYCLLIHLLVVITEN